MKRGLEKVSKKSTRAFLGKNYNFTLEDSMAFSF
jgi:hypothetical protein